MIHVHHLDNRGSVRIVWVSRIRIRAQILGESFAGDRTAWFRMTMEAPQDKDSDEAAKHDDATEIDSALKHQKQPSKECDSKDKVWPAVRYAEVMMPVAGFRIPLAKQF